ncbi:MAG: DUF1080 domain-containing protein [Bacteroidaceae bacterium]|nr:DUF1080 domain-containing protein [Bacteroidaceae bacterium]MBR4778322.1 DUF1080 domain-containing protein [Bacteroidaceae bacterium]
MKRLNFLLFLLAMLACSCTSHDFTVREGRSVALRGNFRNFSLKGEAFLSPDATGSILFHTDAKGESGYEVVLHNGPIDGTLKTGSLSSVRNLYRSLAADTTWFSFTVNVVGKNIFIATEYALVCYTEPDAPYRIPAFAKRMLSEGKIAFQTSSGTIRFRNVVVTPWPDDVVVDIPAQDEQNDRIIRLQQQFFPVIDYHVHLKGGLTKEQAAQMSMAYGINYGVAPNAGEGGVGRMLANDDEVYAYYDEVKSLPFLCGVQGEGRRWTSTFSREALGIFDYLFTDAMTIRDQAGRITRLYHPEEVIRDGLTDEEYMDVIVDQTVKILTNEPADIYANPTYLPDDMQPRYDELWTDERINRVLDVLERYHIALEINPRYRIPSMKIIRMAKERGLHFTFGTNNVDANFGRLEYCLDAIEACGLTADDIWFPSMSIRSTRPTILY